MDARIAPPFMDATDASRLVCVVVVSYQEYSLTLTLAGGDWLSPPATDPCLSPDTSASETRSVPPTGCLQGGAAAPKKILAGGSLEAVVCHAGSQAAGMASAAYPTNSTTAKRLGGILRTQVESIRPILVTAS